MFSTLFIVLVVLVLIESATTAYGLLSKKANEINPFLKWVIKKLGTRIMLGIKLFGTILIFIGIWIGGSVVVVMVLGGLLLIVSIWNIRTLL